MRVLLAAVVLVLVGPVPAGATSVVRYRLPVTGPVVDPWRPPSGPYGAGNRGVDLGVAPGTAVGAAAEGTVTFAGQVGGIRYVVVRHADGIRTTLGGLAEVWVRAGDPVAAGQVVGTAAGALHFGARTQTTYVDPLGLLGPVRVWLVPARGT